MNKINMKCKLYKEMKNDTFSKCLIPAFYPLQTLLNYGTAVLYECYQVSAILKKLRSLFHCVSLNYLQL